MTTTEFRELVRIAPYKWSSWYNVSTAYLEDCRDRYLDQIYRKDYHNVDDLDAIDFELDRRKKEEQKLMDECPF